ncbi:MAG: LamB/YcsF family protein [Devosia sp.]|nr:LamB/YcsF family protein [Devosia sp.]
MQIDINADLGEGFGAYRIAEDEALFPLLTSANVACGFHAGDPTTMDRTIGLAKDHDVALGAHVGYADRQGFGRRRMEVAAADLRNDILYQLGALFALAAARGVRVTHMSAHGALGNVSAESRAVAEAVVEAGRAFDPDMVFLVMGGSALDLVAREAGNQTISNFIADRAYEASGLLVSRARPDAVIKDLAKVKARVVRAAREGVIDAVDGTPLKVTARSVLVHSDTANAVAIAQAVHAAVAEAGGTPTSLPKLLGQIQ